MEITGSKQTHPQPSCCAKSESDISPVPKPGPSPQPETPCKRPSTSLEFNNESCFFEPLVFEFGKLPSSTQHLNGPVMADNHINSTTLAKQYVPQVAEIELRTPSFVADGHSRDHHGNCPHLMLSYIISRLEEALQPTSPFWSEHAYFQEDTPYFSYLYQLVSAYVIACTPLVHAVIADNSLFLPQAMQRCGSCCGALPCSCHKPYYDLGQVVVPYHVLATSHATMWVRLWCLTADIPEPP
jgi:hypothetical protein